MKTGTTTQMTHQSETEMSVLTAVISQVQTRKKGNVYFEKIYFKRAASFPVVQRTRECDGI